MELPQYVSTVVGRAGCNIDALKREFGHRNIWIDRQEGVLTITSNVSIDAMILTFEKICDSVAKFINIRYKDGDTLTTEENKFWDNYQVFEYPSLYIYRLDAERKEHLVPSSGYLKGSRRMRSVEEEPEI